MTTQSTTVTVTETRAMRLGWCWCVSEDMGLQSIVIGDFGGRVDFAILAPSTVETKRPSHLALQAYSNPRRAPIE